MSGMFRAGPALFAFAVSVAAACGQMETVEPPNGAGAAGGCNDANIALGKPASASSSYLPTNSTPDKAVDGVYGDWMIPFFQEHGWSSDRHAPGWLRVDLGADFKLGCYRAY